MNKIQLNRGELLVTNLENRKVLMFFLKIVTELDLRIEKGILFHNLGAHTENAVSRSLCLWYRLHKIVHGTRT